MIVVARFEKISKEQMLRDCEKFMFAATPPVNLMEAYENLKLPVRATAGSAGYDFFAPTDMVLVPGVAHVVATGIRCVITEPRWFLAIFPRSGTAFKYGLRLVNSTGIIDSDYAHADNEGHIILKFETKERVVFKAGDRIAQGILLPYGLMEDDAADGERHGGMGSTGGGGDSAA